MTRTISLTMFAMLLAAVTMTTAARGDGMLFGFEGDTLPGTGSDWDIFNACEPDCSRRLEAGHFLLEWGVMGDLVNYTHVIAEPPDTPPHTLWAEWRFRSNQARPGTSASCDARLRVDYKGVFDAVFMFQDAVFDFASTSFVLGLDADIFHTYRFESLDGENYTFAVDGAVFKAAFDPGGNDIHFIQFGGVGDCVAGPQRPVPVRNEWDFIRYGTIGDGELIVAADPPAGIITDEQATGLTTFRTTFNQPNYVYVNDITVTVTSGVAPNVIATRRLDNGNPNTVEIVLDRPMPVGATTTFTFTDAAGVQTIVYTVAAPEIPASSTWGLLMLALGTIIAGAVVLRRRATT